MVLESGSYTLSDDGTRIEAGTVDTNKPIDYSNTFSDASIATSQVHIGNGQYYDPATGRFINGGNQLNNLPVMVDPAGIFIAPLSLLPLALGG